MRKQAIEMAAQILKLTKSIHQGKWLCVYYY